MIIAVIYKNKAAVKLKPEKNSGLNGIQTHDLRDTDAVLPIGSQLAHDQLLVGLIAQLVEHSTSIAEVCLN